MKPKHVLVIRLSAMGDVAMASLVLYQFVQQNPSVKITVVSKPYLSALFKNMPNTSFIPFESKGKHKGLKGIYHFFKSLKNKDITAVADLHHVLRSKVLSLLFKTKGIPVSAMDKGRKAKKQLTAKKANKTISSIKDTHERYADVFRGLGFEMTLNTDCFIPKPPIPNRIKDFKKAEKMIGIAPFAQYESKTYPLDLMAQVIDGLLQKSKVKIALFGGKSEIPKLQKLLKDENRMVIMAGTMSLQEELACIAHLDAMLAMDSGNGHFSAMYGVPTLTLWGATHPVTGFTPFGQGVENQLIPDLKKYPLLPCSVYGNKVFKGYEAVMRSIAPKRVIDGVKSYF